MALTINSCILSHELIENRGFSKTYTWSLDKKLKQNTGPYGGGACFPLRFSSGNALLSFTNSIVCWNFLLNINLEFKFLGQVMNLASECVHTTNAVATFCTDICRDLNGRLTNIKIISAFKGDLQCDHFYKSVINLLILFYIER